MPGKPLQALLRALRFDKPDTTQLLALNDAEWKDLLALTDRMHLTLALAARHRDILPPGIRERIDGNVADNAERIRRHQDHYREIAAALEQRGIAFLILKGFAHDMPLRPQGDIDLLCAPENAAAAQEIIIGLGYEPVTMEDEFPADHLPLLTRRTGWRWRGDYFDPDQPSNIEVHYRLWNPSTDRIPIEGLDKFWTRRRTRTNGALSIPSFDPQDLLAYASLHALRHLLHGDLLLWHVYELAWMLHRLADDEQFWLTWDRRYSESMRQVLAIVLRLAHQWFGCRLHPMPLSEAAERWIELYAREPAGIPLLPGKHELWLHVSLVPSRLDALNIIRRRLLPTQRHRALYDPNVLPSEENLRLQFDRVRRHVAFLARRAAYHARTFFPAAGNGLLWSLRSRGITSALLRFISAATLFNCGMTVFFLLYNLHLLKRGYHEDFLGPVATANTIGTIAGTIPAGLFTTRFGLKPALLVSFVMAPLICVVRAIASGPTLLIVSAFLGGLAMSLYSVALVPVVAQLVSEKARPLAYSLSVSTGIGIGIAGSMIGGALPDWLGGLQASLIAASAIAALGAILVPGLPLHNAASTSVRNLYPRDPAITRYLAALGLWSLATGALNPFFNVYFATQQKAPVHTIGMVVSASQLSQVLAVLAAPFVLRRLGLASGIMSMQMVTAVALGLLAFEPPLIGAATCYASYMAFQYMSEPGMFTFLMDHAKEEERGGAAALNILVLMAGQAIAATISGVALRRFGYPVVLTAAALLAIVAALCFRAALSRETPVLLERSVAQ